MSHCCLLWVVGLVDRDHVGVGNMIVKGVEMGRTSVRVSGANEES